MALAFNIPNAGPLAQISVGIGDVATAAQLAMGAYGWWKGRETTQSLVDILETCGASLATTSSFDRTRYLQLRKEKGGMLGVIIQNGTILQTPLPNASTANPSDPGLACLRALTAGILCLYSTHFTVEILKDLIPKYLCRKDLEDQDITFDGPLSQSLKQWVQSVAAEEDSDSIRDELLLHVQSEESDLTGLPCQVLGGLGMEQQSELEHVMGVLRWALMPLGSRKFNNYPTRSLRARSMAFLMDRLDFHVHAAPVICHTTEDYTNFSRKNQHLAGNVEVILVTNADTPSDYLSTHDLGHQIDEHSHHLSVRSPIISLREMPWSTFKMFRYDPFGLSPKDIAHFVEIWDFSFRNARTLFRKIHSKRKKHPFDGSTFHIELYEVSDGLLWEHDLSLLGPLILGMPSRGFRALCAAPLRKYGPKTQNDPTWAVDKLRPWIKMDLDTVESDFERPVLLNFCSLNAIILGSLYGLCSNAFISTHESNQGMEAALSMSASIMSELLCNRGHEVIRLWCATIDQATQGREEVVSPGDEQIGLCRNTWSGMLCQMFVDKHTRYQNTNILFGMKDHGLFLVSDSIVRPSIRSDSSLYWHLVRGQPLTIPTDDQGYVLTSTTPSKPWPLPFGGLATANDFELFDHYPHGDRFRVDVEPHWAADSRAVILKIRYQGAPVCDTLIPTFLDRVSFETARCECTKYAQKVALPKNVPFQRIGMQDFVDSMPKILTQENFNNVLIDASASESTSILAISTCLVKNVEIASECMDCALSKLVARTEMPRPPPQPRWPLRGAALIIPCSDVDMKERVITHPEDPLVTSLLRSELPQSPQPTSPQGK